MKKIDFNIELPDREVFDEDKFKEENPELYMKYVVPSSEKSNMEIVKNWVSNILTRAINGIKLDENTGSEKPTKTSDMITQCDFSRVINAVKAHKDGWVKLEDADFDFLCEKWKEAHIACYESSAITLAKITDAIEKAKLYKGNPDKK